MKWLTCSRATHLWCMLFLSSAAANSGCFFWMRVASNEEHFQSPDRAALRAALAVMLSAAKHLCAPRARFFAEFTLSEANALSMTAEGSRQTLRCAQALQ